ncbi:hypothetical protein BVG18_17670 (plasmid) [Acinetobacter lwoffii]|uniref:hypothetical protein n=1 Tax=Acinetobacter lwoffii TaxID=28090 RepID=UPI0012A16A9E|nr:hypothetical protein BVG18_17670 [Acinetobacter lwoffii]
MLKKITLLLIAMTSISTYADFGIQWQPVPAPNIDVAAMNQAYAQNNQQMSQSIDQIANAYNQYATQKQKQKQLQAYHDAVHAAFVHQITQEGGLIERNGDSISISHPDGSRVFCYQRISRETCQSLN